MATVRGRREELLATERGKREEVLASVRREGRRGVMCGEGALLTRWRHPSCHHPRHPAARRQAFRQQMLRRVV